MPNEVTPADLQYLESLLNRKPRPARRQRAKVLWLLARGEDPLRVSQLVGIPKEDVDAIERQFAAKGIGVLERRTTASVSTDREPSGIEKTRNVCGGSARIAGTPHSCLATCRGTGPRCE